MTKSPRPIQPRVWTSLALASVTLATSPALATMTPAPITLSMPQARIWLAQAEGGEAGEAGAIADASPELAYLGQLYIVQGHMVAALDLYKKGMVDEAIGLSYHPEAEMMDAVRKSLADHGAADISPTMAAFSLAMEEGDDIAQAQAALNAVQDAIAQAAAPQATNLRLRFDALALIVRAAANEYAQSTEGGTVGDVFAYHEAHAFIAVAQGIAQDLTQIDQVNPSAERVLAALKSSEEAFGDMRLPTLEAQDPAILLAVAAKVELIASSVR